MSTKNLKRHKQVIIRMTPEEKEFIMKKVERSGCRTLNSYALMMLTCGSVKNVDLSHYHELAGVVNKIGVNINQIARVANAAGNISEEKITELKEMMNDIWQLLKSPLSDVQSTSR